MQNIYIYFFNSIFLPTFLFTVYIFNTHTFYMYFLLYHYHLPLQLSTITTYAQSPIQEPSTTTTSTIHTRLTTSSTTYHHYCTQPTNQTSTISPLHPPTQHHLPIHQFHTYPPTTCSYHACVDKRTIDLCVNFPLSLSLWLGKLSGGEHGVGV